MSFLVPIFVSILESLLTKKMFSILLIEFAKCWADSTPNQYDDKVVAAMAEALGIDVNAVPK